MNSVSVHAMSSPWSLLFFCGRELGRTVEAPLHIPAKRGSEVAMLKSRTRASRHREHNRHASQEKPGMLHDNILNPLASSPVGYLIS